MHNPLQVRSSAGTNGSEVFSLMHFLTASPSLLYHSAICFINLFPSIFVFCFYFSLIVFLATGVMMSAYQVTGIFSSKTSWAVTNISFNSCVYSIKHKEPKRFEKVVAAILCYKTSFKGWQYNYLCSLDKMNLIFEICKYLITLLAGREKS